MVTKAMPEFRITLKHSASLDFGRGGWIGEVYKVTPRAYLRLKRAARKKPMEALSAVVENLPGWTVETWDEKELEDLGTILNSNPDWFVLFEGPTPAWMGDVFRGDDQGEGIGKASHERVVECVIRTLNDAVSSLATWI